MTAIGNVFAETSRSPHDTAFKLIFRKKEVAESFFQHYFPDVVVNHLDFKTLETVNKSFVDDEFRNRHSDMIWKAKIRGEEIYLYLLFEHQSTPDPRMPFRMLCYVVNLIKEFEKTHPEYSGIPLVFPAVLYHGRQRWPSPLRLREMIRGYEDEFEWFVPDFAYQLYDLNVYDDDHLASVGNMALSVVLHLFKHIFDSMYDSVFREAADRVAAIDDPDLFREILEWVVTYFLHARNENDRELIQLFTEEAERIGDERIRRAVMTAAEQIRQKGIEEGKIIGVEQGIGIGRSGLIIKLLKKRFGCTSPVIEEKVNVSDVDILDRFGESIFDFNSLEDAENWWKDFEKGGNA